MKKLLINIKRVLYVFGLIGCVCLGLFNQPVQASVNTFDVNDLNSINLKHPFYEPTGCTASVDTNLLGSDNVDKAFRYFISKGLTPEQSAAIVGNFSAESNVNPTSFNPAGGGQGAYGIAQWRADRQTNLKAKSSYDTLPVQLDYVWEELHSNRAGALTVLMVPNALDTMTVEFEKAYEGSGGAGNNRRITAARDILATYGSAGGVIADPTATTASSCSSLVGNGQNTKFIDGFTIYSQFDPSWKDLPYGTSTIGLAGCGPSAMAMIITALSGKSVTPVDTATYGTSQGLYVPGVGSSWSIAPVLAEHWGLNSAPINADLGKIASTLQSGGLVIMSGHGPKPFTDGGHYIVIRGITAGGKFKIGDSGHSDTSDKEWDPELIIANASGGSVYAITSK